MGVVAAIVFFIFLLIVGIAGIVAGLIGIFIFRKVKKTGKGIGKPLTIVSTMVLIGGCLITIIPVGFFSFIIFVNTMPPDDFVKTEIVIEENGYQDTRFTADGIVYEVLDFEAYDIEAVSVPVFSYKTSGFMNGSQRGNYYSVQNGLGFHLVSDENGSLFCPIEEKESVIAYYTDIKNSCWYYENSEDRKILLIGDEVTAVKNFLDIDVALSNKTKIISDGANDFEIKQISKDGLVYVKSYWFVKSGDSLYYVYESHFADEGGIEYTLVELPAEVAQKLIAVADSH